MSSGTVETFRIRYAHKDTHRMNLVHLIALNARNCLACVLHSLPRTAKAISDHANYFNLSK
ncbi:protein of unknown function (plasmid) [Caballeronia sp. S22]